MDANIIVAVLLLAASVVGGYVLWYFAWGSYSRHHDVASEPQEGKDVRRDAKDSYCHPKINDMMGYEFISVVKVPAELTGGRTVPASVETGSRTDRQARLVGTSDNDPVEDEMRERPEEADPRRDRAPEYDVVETDMVDPRELEQLDRMAPWTDRDHDDSIPDSVIDEIIRNNRDMVDWGGSDDSEAIRIAREQEALRTIETMHDTMENMNAEEEARAIMDEIGNGVAADDIPEI